MSLADWLIIIVIAIAVIMGVFYFLSRWAYRKMDEQQSFIQQQKMTQTAYIIDKKHDKITNVHMPKAVMDNLPKRARLMKMYFAQVKIGPQIVTLICDKNVYNALPVKKSTKIDIAGLYIVSVAGMKSAEEMKAKAKEKKAKAKAEKKEKKK
jgi:uncharacterized membrane protein YqiK